MVKILICFSLILFTTCSYSFQNFWTEVNSSSVIAEGERRIIPQVYRTYELNLEGLKNQLRNAPHERNVFARNSDFIITLPMPDGRTERFRIVEYSLLPEQLQSKYPEIRTYYGEGVENRSSSVRFDITYKGFRAMFFTEEGMVFIDPYSTGTTRYYNVYYKKDYVSINVGQFECTLLGTEENRQTELPEVFSIGETLRTYRLALACTHQYAAYHGNTKPLVMSEFTTAMNRVNGVYEKDVAGRMVFVPNNDTLIFIGSSPYTNNNGNAMLSQNQTVCDTRIGNPNYDIGHVFSTGGGGVAYLNALCNNPIKAGGVTGLPNPVGDPFY
ncbi:MAG: M12 family metallo-peptidase, partial [Ignavibacteria bacterium]|nr:M12 family metallo-peptidase [Ignavibacteria bacterium]